MRNVEVEGMMSLIHKWSLYPYDEYTCMNIYILYTYLHGI